ncbi:T9SS type A sorting domain-containing protein [Paraflavitalea speifideaquila]|uniref:T9SS type A sorting domain-containing protein n=1 Tax=Paraflavitalea speifideaquila TaxID=3076558 RepID=UPI0028E5825D|nr:T9SS type A sorting domain-containing protein [Paraflavitalea speifideiaquila]
MKHLYPKSSIGSWLIVIVFLTVAQAAIAQCPAGSLSPVAGTTYTNGKVVCISSSFSGNLKFNIGSKLVITSGGTYTGDFEGNSGSEIEVRAGGTFKPNNANNLASYIKNAKNGTVILGTGGLTLANGFSAENYGTFTWAGSPTLTNNTVVTNTSCGTMSFSSGVTMNNGSKLNNSGDLTFQSTLTTDNGSRIDNRGRLTVNGDFAPKGYFLNQWQAIFQGSNNNYNSGADSIINLYTFVVKNSINGVMNMRNDGLFWVGGAFQFNSGGGIKLNRTNAQLRVSGSFANNGAVSGNGKVYVAGGFANGAGTLTGKSASEKLFLNKSVGGTKVNTQDNTSMAFDDTTAYTGGAGNPDVSCSILLPMVVSSFKGAWYDNGVNLSWYTVSEINGKQFDIEYSTDGLSYAKAGVVAAKGNSNERINYQYRFTGATSATLYFRLLMVDQDGRTEYSNVVMVKTGISAKVSTTVYPNPFVDKLDITVTLPKAGPVTVKLVDMNGRVVRTQVYTAQAGNNKWTWTGLGGLNKGLYLLEVTAGEEKWMQKLLR